MIEPMKDDKHGRQDTRPFPLHRQLGPEPDGEVFLRRYGCDHYEAHSAGLDPQGLNPLTIQVMQEKGYDLSLHTSKGIKGYLGKVLFQYLITVCAEAEKTCPTAWPGVSHRLHWMFEDRAAFQGSEEEKLAKFREVRDQIERKVKVWVTEQSRTQAAG
jgi:arsenate reductase (thioredoxin)